MYEVWVGLGVMSVGGPVLIACSKVVSGPAGVQPNASESAMIVCNKVVVAASSHHGSPGSIT